MPLADTLCPKHPARMVDEGVDGAAIDLNELPHEVSGGIYQGNLVSSVLVCCGN